MYTSASFHISMRSVMVHTEKISRGRSLAGIANETRKKKIREIRCNLKKKLKLCRSLDALMCN